MWASFLKAWDCGVLSIVLCVIRGLEPSLLLLIAISSQVRQRPHYYFVTLLSRLISSPVRLLTRYLLHLSYDWSLCLAQLTPAYGVTSFRFVRAATARHHQHSVALLPRLPMGTHNSLLLTVFFILVPSPLLQHVIVPSTDSPAFTRLLTAVPTVRCFLTSSLVIFCRWCRIRTCDIFPHIPDTCVPAFVHSANHLAVYLIDSPRRSPS